MRARTVLKHLLLAFAAVLPAAAQVRVAAPAAETGAISAAGATAPLRYQLNLLSPEPALGVGSAFLQDGAAQKWLSANRPEQFPVLVRKALALQDWEQVLTRHTDPRLLREAILSRHEVPLAHEPAKVLALVDRTPALAEHRELFEQAVLEWNILGPKTRSALEKAGADEATWARMTLDSRYETLRGAYQTMAEAMITVPAGHPDYAAQYEAAFKRLKPVMTNAEISEHQNALARAKRLDEALRRAEKAGAAADADAAALLADARDAGDLPTAEAILSRLSRRLGVPEPAPVKPAYDLNARETEALTRRLLSAVAAAVGGTELGDSILADAARDGVTLRVGVTSRETAIAHYDRDGGVVIGGAQLARLTSELGRSPRALLVDDELLADVAVVYSHLFVHEATHHRQHVWNRALPPAARALAYTDASEVEANDAQAVFLRQKRAADPEFAAREARLSKLGGWIGGIMLQPESLAGDPARMNAWLSHGYTHIPTLARAGARMIDLGMQWDRENARTAALVDAELARRGRLPGVERLERERGDRGLKEGHLQGYDPRALVTSELRRLRSHLHGQTAAMIDAARAIQQRARAEIAKLAP